MVRAKSLTVSSEACPPSNDNLAVANDNRREWMRDYMQRAQARQQIAAPIAQGRRCLRGQARAQDRPRGAGVHRRRAGPAGPEGRADQDERTGFKGAPNMKRIDIVAIRMAEWLRQ
jgi:hypothetical protein